ncbi:MAG: cytochrome c [Rhodocyclales bacterium]|nr:cytochrome c [Rhodocyclales bacterium]
MKLSLILAAAVTITAASFAAPALADGKTLYMEKTCIACHGKDAKKPLTPEYPRLAGQNAKYAENQMKDIKSGARANGNTAAMKGVMHLVTDEDIKELAKYLSEIK